MVSTLLKPSLQKPNDLNEDVNSLVNSLNLGSGEDLPEIHQRSKDKNYQSGDVYKKSQPTGVVKNTMVLVDGKLIATEANSEGLIATADVKKSAIHTTTNDSGSKLNAGGEVTHS